LSGSNSPAAAWRTFFRLFAGVFAAATMLVYGFVVVVDPFDTLPASPRFDRWPVDGNARYAFPALARSAEFDSANFGTSTTRLLRPAALGPLFHSRFANLSMNSATAFEQSEMMKLFIRHHTAPVVLAVGLDLEWCKTAADMTAHTIFRFPPWLYEPGAWHRYRHMLDLYSIEIAGRAFAEFTGLKPRVYGRDGYTRFVPDDSEYDPVRAATHLDGATPWGPAHDPGPNPHSWILPGLDLLRARMAELPPSTRKLLYFVPYNHRLVATTPGRSMELQAECKRRVAQLSRDIPGTTVVDFMIPSPITDHDDNYWDTLHYRVGIAERLAEGLAAAVRGIQSDDYRILSTDSSPLVGDGGDRGRQPVNPPKR
jgi:hypothetical protein